MAVLRRTNPYDALTSSLQATRMRSVPSPIRPSAAPFFARWPLWLLAIACLSMGSLQASEPTPGIQHLGTTTASVHGTTLSIDTPAGVSVGDVLVARIANRNNINTTLSADGWTTVGVKNSAGMLKSWILFKVVGNSEPAQHTFTLNVAFPMVGSISALRGVDPLAPVDEVNGYSSKVNGNSSSFTGLPITSPAGNGLALWWGTQLRTGTDCPAQRITPPSGFAHLSDDCRVWTSSGLLFDVASMPLGAAAAQPAWNGSSPFAETNIVQTLALRPAAAPIVYRGTTSAGELNANALLIARPTGVRAGDLLLARVTNRNGADVVASAPAGSGWWPLRTTSSTWSLRTTVFVKTAGQDEPAQYAFGFSKSRDVAGSVSAFGGVDTALPIEDDQGKANSGASTLTPGTPLTTLSNAGMAVWFATQAVGQPTCSLPLSPPSGYLEAMETCLMSSSTGLAYNIAFATLGTAGLQSLATGISTLAATNVTEAVALRRAPPLQTADQFQPAPTTVGRLWHGMVNGQPDTAIPLSLLDQPSGLGYSRLNPEIMYVHSEKDRQTMLAFSVRTGEVLGTYRVTIPQVYDWEDMAVGPCLAGSCVYAADIGSAREIGKPTNVYNIVRVPEPDLLAGETDKTLTGDVFPFTYPGGVRKDAEAFLVHPRTGRMYVIPKTTSGTSEVFTFPTPLPAPGTVSTLVKVGEFTLPLLNNDTNSVAVTAAAMHPSGDRFLVRTYRAVYEFRGTDGTLESALSGTRATLTDTVEGQGESIEYALDGSAYYTLSERASAPYTLKRVDRR